MDRQNNRVAKEALQLMRQHGPSKTPQTPITQEKTVTKINPVFAIVLEAFASADMEHAPELQVRVSER
jgi:hypothetical protein